MDDRKTKPFLDDIARRTAPTMSGAAEGRASTAACCTLLLVVRRRPRPPRNQPTSICNKGMRRRWSVVVVVVGVQSVSLRRQCFCSIALLVGWIIDYYCVVFYVLLILSSSFYCVLFEFYFVLFYFIFGCWRLRLALVIQTYGMRGIVYG